MITPEDPTNTPPPPRGEPPAPAPVVPPAEVQRVVESQLGHFAPLFELHGERLIGAAVGPPVKVDHLTDPDGAYYLVPIFSNDEREPYFVAIVSAVTGELLRLDAIRTTEPDPGHEPWIYALKAHTQTGWHPTGRLVWKQCYYSLTPLQPFHEVKRGEQTGYMDFHGQVHTDLDAVEHLYDDDEPLQNPDAR